LPGDAFRDLRDPDERRREILWIAISFIVILASWLAVVLIFGYPPLVLGMTYDEVVLVVGLGLLLLCSVLYLVAKEREQRYTNRHLLGKLQDTVTSLDQRVAQLDALCSTSAELAGSLDVDHISRWVVESVMAQIGATSASIVLVEERTGRIAYAHEAPTEEAAEDGEGRDYEAERLDSSARSAGPAIDVEERIRAWNERPHMICAPLRLGHRTAGYLGLVRNENEADFTSQDMSTLTTVANMASKAIESAQLHAGLRESYLATVRTLVNSLHARDNYTAAHGQRVARLAIRMAEQMGVPDSIIRDIEVFGPLHDVGKIGIPDAVLLKTGPLSSEERARCQEHCLIGDQIIRPLKPSKAALALVRNHHERWDGKGYPDGLVGEDNHLLARILQVADCYDALISDRPYQAPMSEEETLSHFRMHSGSLYDPAVADALYAVLTDAQPEEAREETVGESVEPLLATGRARDSIRSAPSQEIR
jgi:HD-GYP domain-containing protein (c-di-GMP phosphodiesterase class II)